MKKEQVERKIIEKVAKTVQRGKIDVGTLRKFHEGFHGATEEPLRKAAGKLVRTGKHIEAAELYGLIGEKVKEAQEYEQAGEYEKAAKAYEQAGKNEEATKIWIGILNKELEKGDKGEYGYGRDFLERLLYAAPVFRKLKDQTKVREVAIKLEKEGEVAKAAEVHLALGDTEKAGETLANTLEEKEICLETICPLVRLGRYDLLKKFLEKKRGSYWDYGKRNVLLHIARVLRDNKVYEGELLFDERGAMKETAIKEYALLANGTGNLTKLADQVLANNGIRENMLKTMELEPEQEAKRQAGILARIHYDQMEKLMPDPVERKSDEWYYRTKQHPDSTFAGWKKQENARVDYERAQNWAFYSRQRRERMEMAFPLFMEAGEIEKAEEIYRKMHGKREIPVIEYLKAGLKRKAAEECEKRGDFRMATLQYANLEMTEEIKRIAKALIQKKEWNEAGLAYQNGGMEKEALEVYLKYLKREPNWACCERTADIYERWGKLEEALDICYGVAKRLERKNIYGAIKLYERALKYAKKLKKQDIENEITDRLVGLLVEKGMIKEAMKVIE